MKKILAALFLSCLLVSPNAFGDTATFHIHDAVEEDASGTTGYFNVNNFDNEFGWMFFGYYPSYASYYTMYWRWAIDIPQGSTITEAFVTMVSLNNHSESFNAAFRALAPDGQWDGELGFSTANYPTGAALKKIPTIGPSVSWMNIPAWEQYYWYDSPDISALVQARIDLDDYDKPAGEGGYFGLTLYHVSGEGFRSSSQETTYDSLTAILTVEWTPPLCRPDGIELCGDGIDNNCDGLIDEYCNQCPTADAGIDPAAYVGDLVQLDGSGSTDVDGDMLAYAWSLIEKPEGSAAALSDPAAPAPFLPIDMPGEYIAELVVTDGTCDSEPDIVVVSTVNTCPIAEAGTDATVSVGDVMTLVGAGSDADGDALAYTWLLVDRPHGSDAELVAPDSATPSIAIDLPGDYLVELIVDDGACLSQPDSMMISTYNVRPVANAGPDVAMPAGADALLNGEGSFDLDGDPLSYSWSVLTMPPVPVQTLFEARLESQALISDPSAASPVFYPDVAGDYVVQLIVSDGELESEPDTCVITVSIPECPKKQSYWKKHTDEWPVEYLDIAGEFYDFEELLELLAMPSQGDASLKLAGELIAAKLNVANGSNPTPIQDAIWDAEALLAEYSGKLPFGVKSSSASGHSMKELANELKMFNSGELTPDCASVEGDEDDDSEPDGASSKCRGKSRDTK